MDTKANSNSVGPPTGLCGSLYVTAPLNFSSKFGSSMAFGLCPPYILKENRNSKKKKRKKYRLWWRGGFASRPDATISYY